MLDESMSTPLLSAETWCWSEVWGQGKVPPIFCSFAHNCETILPGILWMFMFETGRVMLIIECRCRDQYTTRLQGVNASFYAAIFALIIGSIPCYSMCCCTPKPQSALQIAAAHARAVPDSCSPPSQQVIITNHCLSADYPNLLPYDSFSDYPLRMFVYCVEVIEYKLANGTFR